MGSEKELSYRDTLDCLSSIDEFFSENLLNCLLNGFVAEAYRVVFLNFFIKV